MVVRLENALILDNLEFIEDLIVEKDVEVRMPLTPESVGLLADLLYITHHITGLGFNLRFKPKHRGYSEKPIECSLKPGKLKLRVVAEGEKKLHMPKEKYHSCHLLGLTNGKPEKIAVSARGTPEKVRKRIFKKIQNHVLLNNLRKYLPRISLSGTTLSVTIHYMYNHLTSFPVNTIFYSPKLNEIFLLNKTDKPGVNYPISSEEEIRPHPETFRVIRSDSFWDSWSKRCANSLYFLAQEKKLSDLFERHKVKNPTKEKRHFKKCFPYVLAELSGVPHSYISEFVNCPPECERFYFGPWIGSKRRILATDKYGIPLAKTYNEIIVDGNTQPLLDMGFDPGDALEIIERSGQLIDEYSFGLGRERHVNLSELRDIAYSKVA